ncbi:hypothetical protein H9P43_001052 [Blastocladiella emersonii ATCC 22665]|nr:hypothetical protein H9P43_001052 [Blastocladiella emersonii ATCC 22665]
MSDNTVQRRIFNSGSAATDDSGGGGGGGSGNALANAPGEPAKFGLLRAARRECRRIVPPIPLALVLAVFIGSVQVLVGLLAWNFTYTSGQRTTLNFSTDLQRELLAHAVSKLRLNINTAERLVTVQRAMWASRSFGVTSAALKNQTMTELLSTLVQYKDMVASQTFTTAAGGLNGYYVSKDAVKGVYEYTQWSTDAQGNYVQATINPDRPGTPLAITDSMAGYNATGELWVTQVQPPRVRSPAVWSNAYGWQNILWLTLSLALFDSDGSTYLGVGCTDLDLGFISGILKDILAKSTIKSATNATSSQTAAMYVFEAATDAIIGTSVTGQMLLTTDSTGVDRSLTLAELGSVDTRLSAINSFVRSKNMRLGDQDRWSFTIPGYYVETSIVTSSNPASNVRWVIVQALPDDTILGVIRAGTSQTAATAGALVGVGIILSTAFALMVARSLRRISEDLDKLARFEFNAVISNKAELRNTSMIGEVFDIQAAFFEMVRAFSRDMRDSRRTSGDRTSMTGGGGATTTQTGTNYNGTRTTH